MMSSSNDDGRETLGMRARKAVRRALRSPPPPPPEQDRESLVAIQEFRESMERIRSLKGPLEEVRRRAQRLEQETTPLPGALRRPA